VNRLLNRLFKLEERGTKAGTATNPLPFDATMAMTCLTAGVLTIFMGLWTNYPFALAPGMGLNA
jgi:xanthine/uracil/vitamin C permease (AzgA family)